LPRLLRLEGALIIRALFMVAAMAALCGCGNAYQRMGRFSHHGYEDEPIAYGQVLVSYYGSDKAFCREAGLFRAAELCRDQGFRFLTVSDLQPIYAFRTLAYTREGSSEWMPGEDPTQLQLRQVKLPDPVGYSARYQFFKRAPEDGLGQEAAEILKGGPGVH
jgi:hypothetical protein